MTVHTERNTRCVHAFMLGREQQTRLLFKVVKVTSPADPTENQQLSLQAMVTLSFLFFLIG